MAKRINIKRAIVATVAGLAALGLLAFAWIWFAPCWAGGCAPLDDLAAYQAEGSQLLDINGKPFGALATVNRRVVSIDSIPEHVPRAFLAVEDQRFYDHGGIDLRRVMGAALSNVQAGGVAEGGSTITMQLARNLFPEWLPYQERSVRRKLMEARVARQIERNFSKEKILELYLNHIYLGEGAYGIEAAAQTYFDKPAAELTVAEAAVIGGLPKAPSQINPVANRKAARERRDLVLRQMAEAGYISPAEAEEMIQQPIQLARGSADEEGLNSSYFVERVRQEMEEAIGSRFYTAGLKIHTTLDRGVQRTAEAALAQQLDAVEAGRFGGYNHPTYPEAKGVAEETGTTPYLQGAVVLMDAATGEVRALVGGRDFEDSKFDRAVLARRQPGSAFKPFVYAAALERYGSPVHIVEDAPFRMVMDGGRVWEPRNYTGRYEGPMTLRDALARSKNTVTARLAQDVGMGSVIRIAHDLGVESEIAETPATALGAAEVRPIELVQAYAAFANGGYRVEPHFIRKVVDRHGRTVWEASPRREQVLQPELAFVLTTMLQDVVNRGTGTAARSAGYRGPAAGKTGTTNGATDVWFMGYTPDLVGAVWMGLDDPQTIVRGASGGTLAAPVWGRIMAQAYEGRQAPAGWSPPSGVVTAEVEQGTGRVVSADCPARGATYTEYFLHAPPAANCQPSRIYVATGQDTLWADEEWGAGMETDTTSGALSDDGIDWPELEELRQRTRVGASAPPPASADPALARDPLGQVPAVPTTPPAATRPAPSPAPQPSRPQPAEAPAPAPEPEEEQESELLGTPVRPTEPEPSGGGSSQDSGGEARRGPSPGSGASAQGPRRPLGEPMGNN